MISCINDTIYVGHEDPQMWEIILFAIVAAFTFVAFLLYIVIYTLRLKETKIVRIMSRLSPKYERDILLNAAVDVGICSIAVDHADFDYIWGMTFQNGNRHLGPIPTTNRSFLLDIVMTNDYEEQPIWSSSTAQADQIIGGIKSTTWI
jgi:hypothetical protein